MPLMHNGNCPLTRCRSYRGLMLLYKAGTGLSLVRAWREQHGSTSESNDYRLCIAHRVCYYGLQNNQRLAKADIESGVRNAWEQEGICPGGDRSDRPRKPEVCWSLCTGCATTATEGAGGRQTTLVRRQVHLSSVEFSLALAQCQQILTLIFLKMAAGKAGYETFYDFSGFH